MKKGLSVLFALVLLCMSAAPAFAEDRPEPVPADAVHEYSYWYVIEQTGTGPVFTYLRYFSQEDDYARESIYIPKTLGGVTLTPGNFNGSVFYPFDWRNAELPFSLDDDNESFTLIDGVLFSKDGKTLVCYPPCEPAPQNICRIPDGTQALADAPIFDTYWRPCVVFPDTLTDIPANALPFKDCAAAAKPGTAAQRFAEENGMQFVPLGEGHTHVYFQESEWEYAETYCAETNRLVCPCGDVLDSQTTRYDFSAGGDSAGTCTCMCHKMRAGLGFRSDDTPQMIVRKIIYCLRRMVWQLLGIRQYCACGARHW